VNLKHGHCRRGYRSLTYNTWRAMIQRCFNPNHCAYPYYGGAGIRVCRRWLSFVNFLADMGRRPSRLHTLDRLDPEKGYRPSNCRWATPKQQAANRRASGREREELTRQEWEVLGW
jgi:hypothetical protein